MTKPNFTSINVILDRSGSMSPLQTDTIGGFNTFLKAQREVKGEAIFTLATFSHDFTLVHDCVKLADVKDLTLKDYCPSGNTALLDAMGRTMSEIGKKLSAMKEEDRPSKVIFLIITDGQENFSTEYNKTQISEMIKHQRDNYSWEFVFLGVTEDSIKDAHSYGISSSNTSTYSHDSCGMRGMISNISENLKSYRIGDAKIVDFFNQDKKN